MTDSMPKAVVQAFKQIGEETIEKAGEEIGKMAETTVITGMELLGGIKPMNEDEYAQKKQAEERKKQEEMAKLRSQMGQGRNVGQEIEEVRRQKEEEEKRKEEELLQQVRQQREAERAEMAAYAPEPGNDQRNRAKMQNQPRGKKRSAQPDPSQMSATSEFKKGID